jgi:hypothetical protein
MGYREKCLMERTVTEEWVGREMEDGGVAWNKISKRVAASWSTYQQSLKPLNCFSEEFARNCFSS